MASHDCRAEALGNALSLCHHVKTAVLDQMIVATMGAILDNEPTDCPRWLICLS
jgi:hypothetical protein